MVHRTIIRSDEDVVYPMRARSTQNFGVREPSSTISATDIPINVTLLIEYMIDNRCISVQVTSLRIGPSCTKATLFLYKHLRRNPQRVWTWKEHVLYGKGKDTPFNVAA